jgi:hypothetical protein
MLEMLRTLLSIVIRPIAVLFTLQVILFITQKWLKEKSATLIKALATLRKVLSGSQIRTPQCKKTAYILK